MKTENRNDLMRVVTLLNFEQENKGKAETLLKTKYNIPKFYISLLLHKIFNRLGNYDFNWPPKSYTTLWDQFHQIASEEVKILQTQN